MKEEHKTNTRTEGRRVEIVGEILPMGRNGWEKPHKYVAELNKLEDTEGRIDRKLKKN